MSRRVKDFIEVRDCSSLETLIEKLIEVRDSLPAASEAVVKMRGDDVFGRQLSISFYREQTVEEALPSLRAGAAIAFSIDTDGAEQLVVVAEKPRGSELRDEHTAAAAERTIRAAIADRHGLRLRALVWVVSGSLPRTGCGADTCCLLPDGNRTARAGGSGVAG